VADDRNELISLFFEAFGTANITKNEYIALVLTGFAAEMASDGCA